MTEKRCRLVVDSNRIYLETLRLFKKKKKSRFRWTNHRLSLRQGRHCIQYKIWWRNSSCSYLRFDTLWLLRKLFVTSDFGGPSLSQSELHDVRKDSNLPLHITSARKLSKRAQSVSAPWRQLRTQEGHSAWKFWLPTLWETHSFKNLNPGGCRCPQSLSCTRTLDPGTPAFLQANTVAFAL